MKEENSDNKLKDLFKDKFADEYLAPPKGAWPNIQGKMATPGRIRKPLYYWLIPVGLLFVIGGGIAVNSIFSTEKVQTSSITTEEKREDNLKENAGTITSDSNEVKSIEEDKTNSNESETINEKPVIEGIENVNDSQKATNAQSFKGEQKNASKTSSTNSFNEENKSKAKSGNNINKVTETAETVNSVVANNQKTPKTTPSLNSEKIVNSNDAVQTTDKTVKADIANDAKQVEKENKVLDNKSETKKVESKIENVVNPSITKAETAAAETVSKETNLSKESTSNEEKPKVSEEPTVIKNETFAQSKENKTSETKIPEKEAVSAKSDEKIKDEVPPKTEENKVPEPLVTESNILLNSTAPRNNLRYDFFLGKGTSLRRSTFYGANLENPAVLIADKSVNMNNTATGFNVRYQITPYFAMRSGIAGGQDRIKTRLFSVTVANTALSENIRLASIDGVMQTVGLVDNALSSNGTDSSTYDMQIFHRQGYLTIPISFVVNTKIQPGKMYYYGSTGFDFMAKGKGRNLLIVNDGELSRNINLSRISDVNKIYTNWNIAFGLAYPFKSRFDLFTEINYSLDISKRLKSSYLITNSAHFQVLLGLRF